MLARLPLVLLVLLLAAPALGQGTSGIVPDPISSRDLDRFAAMLELSPQQRMAIEGGHDAYLEAFATLRETEIETFLQESSQFRFGLFAMSPERLQKSMAAQEKLVRRIRTLDTELFEEVRAVLSEEQAAGMTRVQQARQRQRFRAGLPMMLGRLDAASRIDLTVMIHEMDLEPEQRHRINASLQRYETAMTAARRRIADRSRDGIRKLSERMKEFGFDPSNPGGAAQRRDAFREYRVVLADLSRGVLEEVAVAATLNRRTLAELETGLEKERWRELRENFHRRGYPAARAADNPGVAYLGAALDRDDLDDETRQTLAGLLEGLLLDTDRITDEAAETLARQRRKPPRFLTRQDEGQRETEEKIARLAERRQAVNDAAIRAASGLLDPDVAARLERRAASSGGDSADDAEPEVLPGSAAPETADAIVTAPDPFLPGPVTTRDCARYAGWLGLDETKTTILTSMHEDYLETFAGTAAASVQRVRAAQDRLWSVDGEGNVQGPDANAVAALYRLRRSALVAILAADATFFDDVALVLDEDEAAALPRVRLERQRRIHGPRLRAREDWPEGVGRGVNAMAASVHEEADVDVSRLLEDVDPGEVVDATALQAVRNEYEQAVTAVCREGYESNLRFQESLDTFGAEDLARPGASVDWRRFWRRYRELTEGEGGQAREAQASVVRLNRETLDRLRGPLSAFAVEVVRDAYHRQAYPRLFEDKGSALPQLKAALALADLSGEQRANIQDLAVEFRAAYDDLCGRLVEIRISAPIEKVSRGTARRRARADERRSTERIESERANLNDKTRLRLKSRLSEEQATRVGLQ